MQAYTAVTQLGGTIFQSMWKEEFQSRLQRNIE